MQSILLSIAPLIVSFAVARQPGPRYDTIRKPEWTPPPIAFPIVWTILYLSMGYASARVAGASSLWSLPMLAYLIQLALNVSWTPVFFGRGEYATALTILRTLIVAVVITTVLFWRVDWIAGALLLPYLGWLGVAHELNRSIVRMNPI